MRVSVLGSGSRGNAILVDAGDTRILVDIGFGPRTLALRLAAVGCAPESISGVVLTHEHVDHAQGALQACAKWGWPIHATAGTLAQLPPPLVPVRTLTHGQRWSIGDVHGESVAVPHDATDCAAFVFEQQGSGQRLGIALDLGHVPQTLVQAFQRLDLLVVEANHDKAQLMGGPYPWVLKQRIASDTGHLGNHETAEFVRACAHPGLRAVILAHLSETNNSPALAVAAVRASLRRHGRTGAAAADHISAASQRTALGPISTHGRQPWREQQLALAL